MRKSGHVSITMLVVTLVMLLLLCACGDSNAQNGSVSPSEQTEGRASSFQKAYREPIIPERAIPELPPELPTGILVMIDNYEPARPQSGIDKADIVYEIIAEGGITRYMALFYTQAAESIGPVRSARYYFVQLAKGMDLPYAHVGGSEDALPLIGSLRIKDINEISNAQRYFWQDPSRRRPHATYTSTSYLMEAIDNKQYAYKVPDLPPLSRTFEGDPLPDPQINITYSSSYRVQWIWDESLGENGQYLRHINGKAQYTSDGVPMVADTIIILAALSTPRNTNPVTSAVNIIGGGDAMRIVEDTMNRGSWKKESAERPLFLYDHEDNPMSRKPGNTWIQVVDTLEVVSFGK